MSNLKVEIEELDGFDYLRFHGFGESPETLAAEKLTAWAEPRGLLDTPQNPIYGFNNPNPSKGSPNYGYEFWLVVDPARDDVGEMEALHFDGGLYAVAVSETGPEIGEIWGKLVKWREGSKYHHASHQWMEKALTFTTATFETMRLGLYLPITE